MAFNGTGTFLRIYTWVTDKINSVPITASRMDAEMDGMATGLSTCITKDGQTTITANIPMASHKFTGLSVGNARTDSLTLGQVQDGQFTDLGTTGGAADAYTANPAPTITAYAAPQEFTAKIHTPNLTTTPYLQISGIANPSSTAVIKKLNASGAEIAVEAGDLIGIHKFKRNTANDAFIVMNPQKPYINTTNVTSILDSDAVTNLGLASSVASNALTIALKTQAGTDPTSIDVVKISFRSATAATGTYNIRSVTTATSLVVSSGSTLGTTSGATEALHVYALDNAGTVELAISRSLFADNSIQSTTAEGGAGAADSGTVIYSTTSRSNVPIRLIARLTISEATAGTWVSNATVISLSSKPLFLSYEPIPQTITANGQLVLPHNLGKMPDLLRITLINVTAEGGYTTGQVVSYGAFSAPSSASFNRGISAIIDTTNITLRFGDDIEIIRADTGNLIVIDKTKWTLGIKAISLT